MTDGDGNHPIVVPNADVWLAEGGVTSFPLQGRTNRFGAVSLGPIAKGPVVAAARADGFVARGAVSVPAELTTDLRIPLLRGAVLRGDVVDTDGRPSRARRSGSSARTPTTCRCRDARVGGFSARALRVGSFDSGAPHSDWRARRHARRGSTDPQGGRERCALVRATVTHRGSPGALGDVRERHVPRITHSAGSRPRSSGTRLTWMRQASWSLWRPAVKRPSGSCSVAAVPSRARSSTRSDDPSAERASRSPRCSAWSIERDDG